MFHISDFFYICSSLATEPVVSVNNQERTLITIEFAPNHPLEHPKFTLYEQVLITDHFPEQDYTIYGIEICASRTPSGKLLNQPRWKYKVTDADGNSFHKEESALTRYTKKTCASCTQFEDFKEPNGRGWCNLFDDFAKTDHKKTNDCIINGASEIDTPHSEYQVGSIVKVIDEGEDHTQWAVFEIISCEYNQTLYRNQGSYLTEPEWFYQLAKYQLANLNGENVVEPLWVAENEICDFDDSHNICIQEVF